MDNLFKMFRKTSPMAMIADDEMAPDVDEPPDDQVPDLSVFKKESVPSRKASAPAMLRRESLLTRGLHPTTEQNSTTSRTPRGLSTTSSHSFASTAELTSDLDSPLRSASPSPPPPLPRISFASALKPSDLPAQVVIAPISSDDKLTIVPAAAENDVEKLLGRKRCIMFACKDAAIEKPKEIVVGPESRELVGTEAPARKCKISFACPARPATDATNEMTIDMQKRRQSAPDTTPEGAPLVVATQRRATEVAPALRDIKAMEIPQAKVAAKSATKQHFHEFGTSQDEHEEWVAKSADVSKPKLTIDDCLKKENAIRKIGEEAEEEAEAEERELDHLENEASDSDNNQDDFAPSDDEDAESDGGNESDDENGFADSDDESDAESEYQFWAPSAAVPAMSADNGTHFSFRQGGRSRSSSTSSARSTSSSPHRRFQRKGAKPIRMRPGTPELPDSTDFVCGTFDEDRPLEAAYISCREQKRKEKHKLIPQDIDPSFPTSDPDNEDEDELEEHQNTVDSEEQPWMKDQFEGFDEETRDRRPSAIKISSPHSPSSVIAPVRPGRPTLLPRTTARSPPPTQRLARSPPPPLRRLGQKSPPPLKQRAKSPAPRLFDRPNHQMDSPPAAARLKSPRGSPTGHKYNRPGITINHLAQRPHTDKTSSLPRTPNPFFKDWQKNTSTTVSRVQSLATSPGNEDQLTDMHVRGPVDIVIGLEKKRQKRKEKYWRQHCRKNAKATERRPPQGKGLERMKELGLECAERFRGYGLGQQAQLVLSV